jgi:hypothetical protein
VNLNHTPSKVTNANGVKRLGAFRASSAWCALWLYLCAATPLAPALTALAAALDASHHPAITLCAAGPQVVLHHDCVNQTAHHHGPVARALTIFAQQTGAAQADHVIQFAAVGSAEPSSDAILSSSRAAGEFPPTCSIPAAVPVGLLPPFAFSTAPPVPPGANAQLLTIRTSVLLI